MFTGNICPFSSFCSCVLTEVSWAQLAGLFPGAFPCLLGGCAVQFFPEIVPIAGVCHFCVVALRRARSRKYPGSLKLQICRQLFLPPSRKPLFFQEFLSHNSRS